MQRVNIYGFPHKGLRNALGQLSFKAGSTNVENKEEVASLLALTEEISELLHLHAEEDFVSPPLEAKVPGSTQGNHEDHEKMEELEKQMVEKARSFAANPTVSALNDFYNHVNYFTREYFRHMEEEETQMNNVIWENFEDSDILSWQGQILSKLTPEQFFKWFKYIIPALLPQEQAIMLGGFKENAPAEAYTQTIEGLKPYLNESQVAHVASI